MSETLLPTNLYKPPSKSSFEPRPHIVEKLIQSLQGKLTLFSDPAGYGKTMLVASGPPQAAWLSLDGGGLVVFLGRRLRRSVIFSPQLQYLNE